MVYPEQKSSKILCTRRKSFTGTALLKSSLEIQALKTRVAFDPASSLPGACSEGMIMSPLPSADTGCSPWHCLRRLQIMDIITCWAIGNIFLLCLSFRECNMTTSINIYNVACSVGNEADLDSNDNGS